MTGRHRGRRRDLPRATTLLVAAVAAAAVTVPAIGTRMPHTLIVTAPTDVPWTLPDTSGPAHTHGPTRTPVPLPLAPHPPTPVGNWTPRLYDAWQARPDRATHTAPATTTPASKSVPKVELPAPTPTSAPTSASPAPTPGPATTPTAEPTASATSSPTPDPASPAPTSGPPPTTGPPPSPEPTPDPTADPDCGHGKPKKCRP